MATHLLSFGYRHGGPPKGDGLLIIDVRQSPLRNPFRIDRLRPCRGDDPDVGRYIGAGPQAEQTIEAIAQQIRAHPGPVAIGCVGGHHRSVYVVDRLGRELGIPFGHRNYHDR